VAKFYNQGRVQLLNIFSQIENGMRFRAFKTSSLMIMLSYLLLIVAYYQYNLRREKSSINEVVIQNRWRPDKSLV